MAFLELKQISGCNYMILIFVIVIFKMCFVDASALKKETEVQLICGLRKYNSRTHRCVGNKIVAKPGVPTTLICGLFKRYNPETHYCRNRRVMPRGSASEDQANGRRRSCGRVWYNPRMETCCFVNNDEYKIHRRPENRYSCCRLKVFKNSSKKNPCLNPSANSRLFNARRLPGRGRRRRGEKICKQLKKFTAISGFWMNVNGLVRKNGKKRYIDATISEVLNLAHGHMKMIRKLKNIKKVQIKLKIDEKPDNQDGIDRYDFIIFTSRKETDLSKDGYFYFRDDEIAFKIPSRWSKIKKRLRDILRTCST